MGPKTRFVEILLILPVVLFAESVKMSESDIRECYYKSYRYEKARNYPDAIKSLLLVQQSYPNGYTVNLRLGWLNYLQGNFTGAEASYRTSIKLAPAALEPKLGLLLPLQAQGRYVQMESLARQVLEKDPFNFYGCLRLSTALRMQKKFDLAMEVLARSRRMYPADPQLFAEESKLLQAQGKKAPSSPLAPFAESLGFQWKQQYKTAIEKLAGIDRTKTTDYVYYLRLGWLYYQSGRYANAESSYLKTIAGASPSAEAQLGYLLVLIAQGRHEEVEARGKKILEQDRWNYYANLRVAKVLRVQKKLAPAEKQVQQMLIKYPTDVSFLTELALIRVAQQNNGEAKQLFFAVLTLDPENVTAKKGLAEL
jgi:tetratricopeptide (TPR) repeat protein